MKYSNCFEPEKMANHHQTPMNFRAPKKNQSCILLLEIGEFCRLFSVCVFFSVYIRTSERLRVYTQYILHGCLSVFSNRTSPGLEI